jgi:hypothetical protein
MRQSLRRVRGPGFCARSDAAQASRQALRAGRFFRSLVAKRYIAHTDGRPPSATCIPGCSAISAATNVHVGSANSDLMRQAPSSAFAPYPGRPRGLPAASRSAIRAAISGESRRAATSATTVRRATLPDATGVTAPLATAPAVHAARGLFLRDLQDLFSQRHRTEPPCGGRVSTGPSAPSLGWFAACRARPFALALSQRGCRV